MAQSALDRGLEQLQALSPEHGLMTDLGHVHRGGRVRLSGFKSIEDQISADIGGIVQASKPDLMARGVAVNLLQMAKRIGPQCEATKHEDLSGE